jgi:hypothetical protein
MNGPDYNQEPGMHARLQAVPLRRKASSSPRKADLTETAEA